jgi:hypothetical protein
MLTPEEEIVRVSPVEKSVSRAICSVARLLTKYRWKKKSEQSVPMLTPEKKRTASVLAPKEEIRSVQSCFVHAERRGSICLL